jgi:putative membrane protein
MQYSLITRFLKMGIPVAALAAVAAFAQDRPQERNKDQSQNPPATRDSSTPKESAAKSTTLTREEQRFVRETAASGHAEVEMAKMAQEKASSKDVKDFARMLVQDHQKTNEKLKDIADKKGVRLPEYDDHDRGDARKSERSEDRGSGGDVNRAAKDRKSAELASLSGESFDRRFMAIQIENHQKGVQNFEKMQKNAKDPELRSLVQETLPTLRTHLDKARSVNASLSPGSGASDTRGGSTDSRGNTGSRSRGSSGSDTQKDSTTPPRGNDNK